MKNSIVYVIVLLFLCTGCDSVYHYVVYPPGRIEYTLVPDYEMIAALGDSSYKVGRDSATLIYDKKDYNNVFTRYTKKNDLVNLPKTYDKFADCYKVKN